MTAAPRLTFRPDCEIMRDVRAGLAGGPGSPVQIWRRVGRHAPSSVRKAILDLVVLGEATHEGPDGRRVYRLAAKVPA